MSTIQKISNRSVGLLLMASIATLSNLVPLQAAHAGPNQQQYNQFIANLGTTQLGTDAAFSQQVALTAAGPITLNWKTTTPNTVSGKWTVTDKPTAGSNLASGFVGAPAPGQVAQFKIDFSTIAPQQVPDAGSPKVFYVTVQPVDTAHKGLAPQSNAVHVIYAQAQ